MKRISKNITYKEAVRSNTAAREGIKNIPTDEEIKNMVLLADNVFEPLRKAMGNVAIFISSFFRSKKLNKKVGGSKTSDHCFGFAMDIDDVLGGASNSKMFYWILDNLEFKQLIWEYGDENEPAWVHVSYQEGNNKKEVLRAVKKYRYRWSIKKTTVFEIFEDKRNLKNAA